LTRLSYHVVRTVRLRVGMRLTPGLAAYQMLGAEIGIREREHRADAGNCRYSSFSVGRAGSPVPKIAPDN